MMEITKGGFGLDIVYILDNKVGQCVNWRPFI